MRAARRWGEFVAAISVMAVRAVDVRHPDDDETFAADARLFEWIPRYDGLGL